MTTMTKEGFRPSPGLIRAAENLLATMAIEQEVRPIVEDYESAILAKHQFKAAPRWNGHFDMEKTLDRKHSFLLSEKDAKIFYAECFAARDAAGLKVAKPDNCPLLEAENLRIDAEAAFIQSLGDLPGMATFKSVEGALTLELRAKIVDCGLRLVVPLVADADGVLKRLLSGPTPATN